MKAVFLTVMLAGGGLAAEIVMPAPALERTGPASFIYRTNTRATGTGTLTVRWTDTHNRLIEDLRLPVELNDETDIGFHLDLRRAVAMRNNVEAHLSFTGRNRRDAEDRREEDARTTFIAKPPFRRWWDYEIVMWQQYPREAFVNLRSLGITAGQYVGRNPSLPEFLIANDLRWYAENIATDFYSEYHRWFPDRPVNWKFHAVKELFKQDPSSREAFKRHPSLTDERWLKTIHDRLVEAARWHSPYRPLFYSLGDETGIADLSAYWDFDFSDESLIPMRQWLKQRYGTLAALNREWATNFSEWDRVMPMTTDEAMKRTDENYAAWADFKDWMDEAFARALKMGNDAVRSVDPDAYVGIGGGQMPGWGGYDYYRVSRALTAIEPYDIGNNIEIIRSVNPNMAVVTTSFATGPWEKHRVWYELLHGNRGLIIWDDKNGFADKTGAIADRGREVEPYYTELRRGIGALLVNSRRISDPIAIHYSQASMRTEWMRAQRGKGAAWVNRNASTERKDSDFLRVRESWCRLIEDQGLQYDFVGYGDVEKGRLVSGGYRVLILPRSNSLSPKEARAIRDFVEHGGTVIADSVPGEYNEHSRKLDRSPLADLFTGGGKAILFKGDILNYHQNRLVKKEREVHQAMGELLAGVKPQIPVVGADGRPIVGVEIHSFVSGGVRIVAVLSNPQLRVDELGPPEFRSNERFTEPAAVRLMIPENMHVYDIRKARYLGGPSELRETLDPYEPAIYAVSPAQLPALELSLPARAKRGDTAQIAMRFAAASPAAAHVVHVEVFDPAGKRVPHYSGNVLVSNGAGQKVLPLAHNDSAGTWRITAHDILTGVRQVQTVSVE
ncbi:MAG TPA: alpha-amylase family protein [Bryobacteraceae bacterium]|nr:alpha-amylase family protein [Bryobacteraceae bacterium]